LLILSLLLSLKSVANQINMEVLIVDDHPVVIEGMRKLLTDSGIARNCMVAQSVKECMHLIDLFNPELILLDINLPDGNGIDLCLVILKKLPKARVLALSSFAERSYISRMMEYGAMGYLLKNSSEEEILEAIKDVMSGKKHLGFDVAEILKKDIRTDKPILTRREKEVLTLIADGLTNHEIAEKAFISPHTVDSHRKNLLLKLSARNTAELVKIAIVNRLIEPIN
jgi:DNA-binding NarL/FixJ family response regulator